MGLDETSVGTLTVRDKVYAVTFQFSVYHGSNKPSEGTFFTEVRGKRVSAKSIDKLYDALMRETKRQAVEIDVRFLEFSTTEYRGWHRTVEPYFRPGTATKQNAKTGSPVIRYDDGEIDNGSGRQYGQGDKWKPDTPIEVQLAYLKARHDQRDAEKRQHALKKEWTFNLHKACEEAVEAKLAE